MDGAKSIPHDSLEVVLKLIRHTMRFWWVAAIVISLGAGATMGILRTRVNKYTSEASVQYQEGMQWSLVGAEGTGGRRAGQRLKDYLLGRQQLASVIEDLKLYPWMVDAGREAEAVEIMRSAIVFKVNEGDTFQISYTAPDAEDTQRVVAKLTEMLIRRNQQLRTAATEEAKEFWDKEFEQRQVALANKELERAKFLAAHPEYKQESLQRASVIPKAEDAPSAGGSSNDVLATLERQAALLRAALAAPATPTRPEVDPQLLQAKQAAQTNLDQAQGELKQLRASGYTDTYPGVKSALTRVRSAEKDFAKASAAVKAAEAAPPSEVLEIDERATLRARLDDLQRKIAALRSKKTTTDRTPAPPVDKPPPSDSDVGKIKFAEAEWQRIMSEVDTAREQKHKAQLQAEAARTALTALQTGQGAQIQVIDPAFLPAVPIGLSAKKLLMVGIIVSLGLGMGLALLFAILDDRVYDPNDVEKLELVPVLIAVPRGKLRFGKGRRG